MVHIAILANLVTFSIVVSQPLFYLVVMAKAQRALCAAAYIELRQHINPIMNRRVPVIYLGALITSLFLIANAYSAADRIVLATSLVALLCLIGDLILMLRESVPINSVIDRWSTTDYSADWEVYRDKWLALFRYRQIVLLVGFSNLLVGAVFRS